MSNCATYRCMITIALGGLIRANSEPASVGIHCKLIAIYIDRGCDRRDAKYKATRERKMTWCRRCVRAIMRSRGRSSKPPVATCKARGMGESALAQPYQVHHNCAQMSKHAKRSFLRNRRSLGGWVPPLATGSTLLAGGMVDA